MYHLVSPKGRASIRLLTVLSVVFMLGACAANYSKRDLADVDRALLTGDESELSGKTKFLYQRKLRERKVEQAAINRDPSGLDHIEKRMYKKELRRVKEREKIAEKERVEAVAAARLAAIEAEAERTRLAELEAERLRLEKERKRQERIAAAKAYKKKIAQPIHPEWNQDMANLTEYFKTNGFEPAHRLVGVYARTMQFLVHESPSAQQFSSFLSKYSDIEQLDHRRLFVDETGVDLVAKFWESHGRADLVPQASNN